MPLWDRGIRKYSDLTAREMELIFGSSGMVNRIIGTDDQIFSKWKMVFVRMRGMSRVLSLRGYLHAMKRE